MSIFLKEAFDRFSAENYKSAILSASMAAEKFGYKIYLIGGIVRDLIIESSVKDIDIVVEGNAVDFCLLLEKELNCKIISIQENLKTAKIAFNEGIEIDFASTREEKYAQSGILPAAYNFGCTLKQDVKRRDFTINTMAMALTGADKYMLIDYCGGFEDIKNRKIRILHEKSFIDDPSRIIRALKFQARFNFELEEKTYNLMRDYLKNVNSEMPLERIKNELMQYFSIKKSGLYNTIIETNAYKLISDNPVLNFNEEAMKELISYDLFDSKDIWFIYVVLLIVNSNFSAERLNLSAYEKKVTGEIRQLLLDFPVNIKDKLLIYNKFKDKYDITLAVYYIMTEDKAVKEFLNALRQIKVLITGDDLINLGFIPSKYFSELFEKILKEKLYGKLKSREEEIKFVKRFLKKEKQI